MSTQEITDIARRVLSERGLTYDIEQGLEARFYEQEELRDGTEQSVWIVSYLTAPNNFIDQREHFIYLTKFGEFIYIITPVSYIQ